MNAITVTDATIVDIPKMCEWGEGNWQIWASEKCRFFIPKDLKAWIVDPRGDMLLVARDGKTLAGMCIVTMMRGWVYLDAFFVDVPYRRKGVGTMILQEISRRIQGNRDISLQGLFVNIRNNEAREFYRRMGFSEGYSFLWMEKWMKQV